MRVLFIWHSAADPHNRPLFAAMIRRRDVDLRVLTVPVVDDRLRVWRFARPVAAANAGAASRYRIVPGRVLKPRSLGHHVYLDLPRHLREFRPDVVHAVTEAATLLGVEVTTLVPRLAPRARLALHVIQNLYVDYRWPWPLLERYTLRRTPAAVAYSPGAWRIMERRGWRGPHLITPFGVNGDLFHPRRSRFRRRLRPRLPVVGWVGRMFLGKGLHVLLRASALMRRPHQLLIVGDGPRREPERALARELGVAPRVTWIGSVRPDEAPEWYAAMDVYTHPAIARPADMPAWVEQFARTLPEAMLTGVPVVASRSGEIPWVVGDGGLMIKENDPRELARALDRVLGSTALRRRLGAKGRARALAHLTFDRAADRLVGFWRSLATGRDLRSVPDR